MVENQKPINSYLIDWLSFTSRVWDPLEVIEKVGLSALDFKWIESAKYGYNRNYTVDGLINVMYSENRADMGVHVEMTGQGVRKYETLMAIAGHTWVDVFEKLRSFATFSRIDLALDEYDGLVSFDDIIEKINSGEHVGRCRSFKVITGRDSSGGHTGTTIYMGSNKSDTMLRVYEKNYERQQKGYEVETDIWNRWELVLKHEKANYFVNQLLDNGYSFGEIFKGILADLIRFVDQSTTDSNKRRWKKSIWWEDFLEGIEPIQLKGKEYQPNLTKTLNWVEKSTLTAIKGLSAIAKEEKIDFIDLVANSKKYNHDRYVGMLKEYERLSESEKAIFINSLKKTGH